MGKLKINGDLLLTGSISFQTPNCITPAFSAKVDSNGYGQNLLIGAGGNTIIGGGEGAQEFFAAAGVKDEENIYLAATDIYMYTDCNDIAKRKLVMSLKADGTISLPNSKKIDTDGTFSGRAAGLYRMNHFTTEEQVDSFQAPNTLQYCTIGAEYTPIGNDGVLISAGWSSGGYGAQIWIDDGGGSGGMKIRSFGANNGANWNEWQTVLTSGNYNSYAPSLTGTGASGNWNISVKNLYYAQELSTAELLDGFNEALRFKASYWTNSLVPGCGNGIILNMGWTSATYGAQLAIDDDPTYFIALRQKNGSGWADWKRIPMGDGTGASGTWGINVTGSAGSVAWGNVTGKPSTFTPSSHTHDYVPYGVIHTTGVNFNTIINSGFYRVSSGNTNGPSVSDWGQLLVMHGGGDTITQIYGNYSSGDLFTRSGNPSDVGGAGSWTSWKKLLNSDNYSSYCLPLSGGTMTGTITTPGDDSVVIKPAKSNYDQVGGSDAKFWKMFATYGFFDTVVTSQHGTDVPTRRDLPVGSIYFRTIN